MRRTETGAGEAERCEHALAQCSRRWNRRSARRRATRAPWRDTSATKRRRAATSSPGVSGQTLCTLLGKFAGAPAVCVSRWCSVQAPQPSLVSTSGDRADVPAIVNGHRDAGTPPALATGGRTDKPSVGHDGGNHPGEPGVVLQPGDVGLEPIDRPPRPHRRHRSPHSARRAGCARRRWSSVQGSASGPNSTSPAPGRLQVVNRLARRSTNSEAARHRRRSPGGLDGRPAASERAPAQDAATAGEVLVPPGPPIGGRRAVRPLRTDIALSSLSERPSVR